MEKIKNVDTYSMKHMGYDIDILVGGWATHLKNMKVSWDDDIPNTVYGKNKKMFQATKQI
jgi:hypothetical protein